MRFVDRTDELAALRTLLAKRSSFSLVFGQRRVGKTFLLQRLLEMQPRTLYFLADESTPASLLRRFHAEVMAAELGGPLWADTFSTDWGLALSLLVQTSQPKGLVLVLDEVQYLLAGVPALSSILQRLWDAFAPQGRLHIILCGSALGSLKALSDEGQPLHGRFDLKLKLRPFDLRDAQEFFEMSSPTEVIRAYGVFGGLARHLAAFDPSVDLATNTQRAILSPLAPLHEAPLDLLRTEHLTSHGDAHAVLAAVAAGENRFSAIASRSGLTSDRVTYVLDELVALDIVERQRRFGDRSGSRYTRYRCRDPFITFWFRYVASHRSALAARSAAEAIWAKRIVPGLETHMGWVFEEVVRQGIAAGAVEGLPAIVDQLAPWWSRDGQVEIDWILRSDREIWAVECKWRPDGEVGLRDLDRLRRHVEHCPRTPQGTHLALVTAGRFSAPLRAVADAEGIVLAEASMFLA